MTLSGLAGRPGSYDSQDKLSDLRSATFISDVKDCFLEALQLGFPNGLEDQSLKLAEAELAEAQEQLKLQKWQNDQVHINLSTRITGSLLK